MSGYLNAVIAGLVTGSIYGVLALSYNVIFATTGVLNFAQGEFFMLGSVGGAYLVVTHGWPMAPALLIVVLLGCLVGGLTERLAVRPALAKGNGALGWVLSTLGVSLLLSAGAATYIGDQIVSFPPIFSSKQWNLDGATVSVTQISLVALLFCSGGVLYLLYTRTILGKALGAIAQDREAAQLRGIPVSRLSTLSFVLGGALAALIGFFAAPLTAAYPTIGLIFGLKGFIAASVGGLSDTRGAVIGGLLLGVVESLGGYWFGAGYQSSVVLVILLVVLLAKPTGLFGARSVRVI